MLPASEVQYTSTELLRRACSVLNRAPEDLIRSISVTLPITDPVEHVQLLLLVIRRLSEEYGICALVERSQHSFSVRFSRYPSAIEAANEEGPSRGGRQMC